MNQKVYEYDTEIKNQDGSICYIIGITKAIRMKLNKSNGDMVHVVIYERV